MSNNLKFFIKNNKMKKYINIPNIITTIRIILAPVIFITIAKGYNLGSLVLFILAAITDFFDGLTARKLNLETEFGRIYDPIGDKILAITIFAALYIYRDLPLYFVIIVILRDIFMILGSLIFLKKYKKPAKPNILGKTMIFFFGFLTIVYIMDIEKLKPFFIYSTLFFVITSFLMYIYSFIKMLKDDNAN